MENGITIEMSFEKIKIALDKAADDIFRSSYDNPVKKLLEDCIKEKDGELKKIISEIINEAIGNPVFKAKMGEALMQKMITAALVRN